jgi:hypothetical protein
LLVGVGIWVNPLIVVYLVPIGVYLLLTMRGRLFGAWVAPAAGCVLGALPLIDFNLRNGFATAEAMLGGSSAGIGGSVDYLYQMFRVSLPVMAGIAQASSSQELFWPAFWASPAGAWPLAAAVGGGFILLALAHGGSLRSMAAGGRDGGAERGLLVMLMVVVPAVFVLSKFRDLVTEPRYLLPLYSAAPLMGLSLASSRLPRLVGALALFLILSLNLYSVVSLDPTMTLPDTAVGSTAQNRAELADFLLERGLDRVYTDYWIAYPLAFESAEKIVPSVLSGGFNRYVPYAHLVSISDNPAFVFIAGSKEERAFLTRLAQREGRSLREEVSIYTVYSHVAPLQEMRP